MKTVPSASRFAWHEVQIFWRHFVSIDGGERKAPLIAPFTLFHVVQEFHDVATTPPNLLA